MNETHENVNSLEPEAVIPQIGARGFHKVAEDNSGRTSDHAAWLQDMADRQKRTQELEAKRQANKPQEPKVDVSTIDEVLSALEAAADEFEGPNGYGKPNLPLIGARNEVERLKFELSAAETKLAEIESRGDSVQRLTDAVRSAESQLQQLVSRAESEEILRLAHAHYGWQIPWEKVASEMKRDFRNHASVMAFKLFYVPRSFVNPGQTPSVESLQQQLQLVGEKLTELREHLGQSED
jgi:predicted RNase H-like nuclease (RuvC/YqgF family)